MRVYLDNASTTPLDPEVFEAMKPYWFETFGNPSSIHNHGREARSAIEKARKQVAELINVAPSEIFFTSGGTEADNWALKGAVYALGVKNIISSKLEHHAVLHTIESLEKQGLVKAHWVTFDEKGIIDMEHLNQLCIQFPGPSTLWSLMHGNNEIGNLIDLHHISHLCQEYQILLHSDAVQTVGHFAIDLQKEPLHFLAASAHKFHGPKGIGFMYQNPGAKVCPLIEGGSQERNMRAGTENVASIVGMAKALELTVANLQKDQEHILNLKRHLIDMLQKKIPGTDLNGNCLNHQNSMATIVNALFPPSDDADMILMKLDIDHISVSGGSACTSGSSIGSHVLDALKIDKNRGAIRFSLSKLNTVKEIDYAIDRLTRMFY